MTTNTKQIDDGGPAFPRPMSAVGGPDWSPHLVPEQDGLSCRDYFAAKAMQGDWAAQSEVTGTFNAQKPMDNTFLISARMYYRMADAMIAARKLPEQQEKPVETEVKS